MEQHTACSAPAAAYTLRCTHSVHTTPALPEPTLHYNAEAEWDNE